MADDYTNSNQLRQDEDHQIWQTDGVDIDAQPWLLEEDFNGLQGFGQVEARGPKELGAPGRGSGKMWSDQSADQYNLNRPKSPYQETDFSNQPTRAPQRLSAVKFSMNNTPVIGGKFAQTKVNKRNLEEEARKIQEESRIAQDYARKYSSAGVVSFKGNQKFNENEMGDIKMATFIINPKWGIGSIQNPNGMPRIVLQVRRFKHMEFAPSNPYEERDCILIVFTDITIICCKERGKELRLLIPPCPNSLIFTGPSFAPGAFPTVFSIRFDDVGPIYLRSSSNDEARYWIKCFADVNF